MERVNTAIEKIRVEHKEYQQLIVSTIKQVTSGKKYQVSAFNQILQEEDQLRNELIVLRDHLQDFRPGQGIRTSHCGRPDGPA